MPALTSPTLRRVLAGDLCSGCGLCAGISGGAVEMTDAGPGFARPRQLAPLDARTERTIAEACPGAVVAPWPCEPNVDMYWGPCNQVLTGFATDPVVRFQASSGGALSVLAAQALADGMVDAVIHVEADPARPTRNRVRLSRKADEVLTGAGSRYAASSPLADIDALLGSGRRFAFIGKPCDVSALRQLALHDERVDRLIPIKLSFFCGGMPSHAAADRIVKSMGLSPDQLVSFRYRGFGWPGRTVAETVDGARGDMSYEASWGGHLSKDVQFRCKICPDAVGGVADIAAADAWYGGEKGYPKFEERDGRSLVVTRTAAGDALLKRCIDAGAISVEPLPLRRIDEMQPSQANRKRLVPARRAACRTLLQPVPRSHGLMLDEAAGKAPFLLRLRNYLGTLRRIVMGLR